MKYLVPVIIMLVFLGIIAFASIYLSNRLAWVLSIEHKNWMTLVIGLFPALLFVALFGLSNATSPLLSMLYQFAAFMIGAILYLLMMTLVVNLVHLIHPLSPAVFGWVSLVLTLLFMVYGVWNARTITTKEITLSLPGLEQETQLLQLSDLHIGHFRGKKYMERIVNLGKKKDPDIVVITGDLFDGRIRMKKESIAPLDAFDVPIYYVEGNHDGYTGMLEIKEMLKEMGVKILDNTVITSNGIQLVGLKHMRADSKSNSFHGVHNGNTIKEVLPNLKINKDFPSVLLHHSPDGIAYAEEAGIDLYLAGHTHGGQFFPVTLLNDLLFKYNRGVYRYRDTAIFVSTGSGTFGPPIRIGTRSMITLIHLKPEAE